MFFANPTVMHESSCGEAELMSLMASPQQFTVITGRIESPVVAFQHAARFRASVTPYNSGHVPPSKMQQFRCFR